MNVYFKEGFNKVANPVLAQQSASGLAWDKPTEHKKERQQILEMYEHRQSSRKGNTDAVEEDEPIKDLEKKAFGPGSAGLAVAPSIGKRIAENSFEYSKRFSMGLPEKPTEGLLETISRPLSKKVHKDLDFVKNLKPGLRKRFNTFLMNEGPGFVYYAPSEKGKQIGKSLGKFTKFLSPENQEFVSNLSSPNKKISGEAAEELLKRVEELKVKGRIGKKILGYSALAGLGIIALKSLVTEEGPTVPLNSY